MHHNMTDRTNIALFENGALIGLALHTVVLCAKRAVNVPKYVLYVHASCTQLQVRIAN